ncbi:MAG: hypothetical protein IPK13_03965 [Deltaproteobacteria bacterium]|nr:hypothetical protein [Deltaproteobacteria bacterium]
MESRQAEAERAFFDGAFDRAAQASTDWLAEIQNEPWRYAPHSISAAYALLGLCYTAMGQHSEAAKVHRTALAEVRAVPDGFFMWTGENHVHEIVRSALRTENWRQLVEVLDEFRAFLDADDLRLYTGLATLRPAVRTQAQAQVPSSVPRDRLESLPSPSPSLPPSPPASILIEDVRVAEVLALSPVARGSLPLYRDFCAGVLLSLSGSPTSAGAEHLAAFVLRAQREQPPLGQVYRWELAIARRAVRRWVDHQRAAFSEDSAGVHHERHL